MKNCSTTSTNSHPARGGANVTKPLRRATFLVMLTVLPMCLARIGGTPTKSIDALTPIIASRYLGKSDVKKKNRNVFKSDKKLKNLETSTFAREVVSILKDRKHVVGGSDKSKGLYPKELREKVFKEFNIKDGNGKAKDMFDDALKRLKKKGEVVINDKGKVKLVVSMDHSQKSKNKSIASVGTNRMANKDIEIHHFAREVISILKDRKKVVNGVDKSKGLYPKQLRERVFKTFGVKDGDGDAKNLFSDAIDRLEKKGEVTIEKNGMVKLVVSMDHSQKSKNKNKSDDEDGLVFNQATIDSPIESKAIEDSDADGLTDTFEESIGTDVLHPDSDRDGASDGEEVAAGTNPNNADHKPEIEDQDNDLVSDTLEEIMGTDPTLSDTDKDNLSDFEELQAGTSGIHPDSDLDGASDGEEVEAGTDALDASDTPEIEDQDKDGVSDTLEEIMGTDPTKYDTDGDNASDGEELRAQTDALDPEDTPLFILAGEGSGSSCTTGCKVGVSFVAVAAVVGSIVGGLAVMKRRQKVDEEYEHHDEEEEVGGKAMQEDETVQVDV